MNAYDPHSKRLKLVAKAKRSIELEGRDPRLGLKELAGQVGMSRWHFLRVFRDVTGFTPKDYQKRIADELDGVLISEIHHAPGFATSTTTSTSGSKSATLLDFIEPQISIKSLETTAALNASFSKVQKLAGKSAGSANSRTTALLAISHQRPENISSIQFSHGHQIMSLSR
jgi:AraC-like DNA-binding protein